MAKNLKVSSLSSRHSNEEYDPSMNLVVHLEYQLQASWEHMSRTFFGRSFETLYQVCHESVEGRRFAAKRAPR